jgi:uncharacterized protein (TIGR03083 family)
MTGDERTDAGLRLLEGESARFLDDVEGLGPDQWEQPTNCPPWTVRLLTSHLTRGGESYVAAIEAGLRGELRQFGSREERERRMHEIAAQETPKIVSDFRSVLARFAEVVGGLDANAVETLGVHSTGPRTVRWWVDQRLAEVAFHRWDLEHSLGRQADLDPSTAEQLLPMLMDENFEPISQRSLPGTPGRFRLVERGGAGGAWTVISSNGFAGVSRRSAAPVDATIEADTAALALLVYGRRTVADLERVERLHVSGDREAAHRYAEVFRGP